MKCTHLTKSNVVLAKIHYLPCLTHGGTNNAKQKHCHDFCHLKYINDILSMFKIRVMRIRIWVLHLTNVHKNGDLIIMPMHILHLILDFKTIILKKINY